MLKLSKTAIRELSKMYRAVLMGAMVALIATGAQAADITITNGSINDGTTDYTITSATGTADIDLTGYATTSDLATANGKITANETAISGLQTGLTTANGKITANESAISGLQTDLTTANGKITANETAISGLQTGLTTANGKITANESAISGLQTDLTAANGKITANETAISGLQTGLTTANGKITANESAISGLQSAVSGITGGGSGDINTTGDATVGSLDAGSGEIKTTGAVSAGSLAVSGTETTTTGTGTATTTTTTNGSVSLNGKNGILNISGTETITTGTGTATTTTTTNGSISLNGIDGSLTTTGDATIGGGITIGQYGAPTLGGKDGYLEIVGSTITGDEGAVYMGIVDDATDPNYRSSYVSADMLDTTNLNIYNKNTGDLAFSVDGSTGNITNKGNITSGTNGEFSVTKSNTVFSSINTLTGTETTTTIDTVKLSLSKTTTVEEKDSSGSPLGTPTTTTEEVFSVDGDGNVTSAGTITANGGLTVKDGEDLTLGGTAVNAIDDGTSGVVPFATTPTASTTLATVATVKNATSSLSAGLGNLNYSSTNYIKAGDNLTKAVSALDSNLYRLEEDVDEMNKEMKAGFASVAALSALQPNARAFNDTQISMGVGNYRGQTGFALGGFHYVNDNLMMNVGAAYAGDHSATFRGGLTFGW